MEILARDMQVLAHVGHFSQLTASQINSMVFIDSASKTTCTRSIKRLREDGLLTRINRRIPGGAEGGSPQYVYRLTEAGHKLFSRSKWRRINTVNYHHLEIGEAYVAAKNLEKAGAFLIREYRTEPDSHETIAGAALKPDLYLELEYSEQNAVATFWLEIDRDSEGPKKLFAMIERYAHAWENSTDDSSDFEVFPLVAFVVPNKRRLDEFSRLLTRLDEDTRQLFRVLLKEDIDKLLTLQLM